MPNHIYQKITISDWNYTDKFKELKNSILNEKRELDFNLIIPQPENIFNGNLGEKQRLECIEQNIPNWYDWNRVNWGTKWNSYDFELLIDDEDTLSFKFQTAWNIPKPIINKLITIFQGCQINYLAVDEGGFFATQINVNEVGELEEKDLKEYCDVLMFAIN